MHRDAAALPLLLLSLISLYVFICGNRVVVKRWGRGSSSQRKPTCPSAEMIVTVEYVSGPGTPGSQRERETTLGLFDLCST